ncbi:putative FkbM family methyltransferase [Pyrococcus sp. ST04]|nr:putative FkbM family methyltransferase [Pyrococcus sp. ST04]
MKLSCKSGLRISSLSKSDYRWLGTLSNVCLLDKMGYISHLSEDTIVVNGIKIPIRDMWIVNTYFLLITKLRGNIGVNPETNRPYVEFHFKDRLVHFDLPDYRNGWGVLVDTYINQDYNVFDVSNKTVVDVGAYIGDTAVFFALNGAKRVYSFEPHPILYQIAQYNIKINKLSNVVRLKNAGVGGHTGQMLLETDEAHLDSSGYVSKFYLPNTKHFNVPLFDIAELFDVLDSVDILKVDCEGCEFEVLRRLYSTGKLEDINDGLVMEVHEGEGLGSISEILDILSKAGFRCKIYKSFRNGALNLYLIKAWRGWDEYSSQYCADSTRYSSRGLLYVT